MTRFTQFAFMIPIALLAACKSTSSNDARAVIAQMNRYPQAGSSAGYAAGISLGDRISDVKDRCLKANQRWIPSGNAAQCTGPVYGTLAKWHQEVLLIGCDDKVCAMIFEADPSNAPLEDQTAVLFSRLESQGFSFANLSDIPAECRGDPVSCVKAEKATISGVWRVEPDVYQVVTLDHDIDGLHLWVGFYETAYFDRVVQSTQPAADAEDDACSALEGFFPCNE